MAKGWLIAQMVPGYCSGSKPQNHARALPRQIIATAQHYQRRHIRLPVSTTYPRKPSMPIQEAATGNLSVSAIKENRARKVVSIR